MLDKKLGKTEFYHQPEEGGPEVRMTLHPHMTLPDLLEQFEMFLKAIGYHFEGELDIYLTREGEE